MNRRQIRRLVRDIAASLIQDYPSADQGMDYNFPTERDQLIAYEECERLHYIILTGKDILARRALYKSRTP